MADLYRILAYILAYIGLMATSFYIINIVTYYRKNKDPPPSTEKKVSIIIPAYNEEKSMKRTLESALKLDYPKEKLEIIVIDDGSKDDTYEIAKKFESRVDPKVKVLTKPNGGKGTALNLGIKQTTGEIILTMDADTFVHSDALKIMMGYFINENVMCVSPSMGIHSPKNYLQKIQQIEYYMGVFLRKSFATMNAVHITPGAFSAYRKTFFDKHGDFEVGNLTEDLEIALRIQSHNYIIDNATKAVAYTLGPNKFGELLVQRKRWYVGLMKNLWTYRRLFGPKKGALGAIVLPTAVSTVALSVFLTAWLAIKGVLKVREELLDLKAINFQFNSFFELNAFTIERFFFTLFTSKLFLLTVLFLALLGFYMKFARKQMRYQETIRLNFVIFAALYSLFFAFWWIVSFFYVLFNREVKWRNTKNETT
jgi:cellulose synthase/poly-beta-1,6-N-acetylglucosamine synthase-like glycosyltransferase